MSKKTTKSTLPASIVNALPASAQMMKHLSAAAALIPQLDKDMARAKKAGPVQLARAYVAMYRMCERMDEMFKPLLSESRETPGLMVRYKTQIIPEAFEQAGVPNVALAEGFRVGLSSRFLASIKAGMHDRAYQWLRENGLADLIKPVVNSSSLSAAGRELQEDRNIELPPELFNVAYVPTTSVTSTK